MEQQSSESSQHFAQPTTPQPGWQPQPSGPMPPMQQVYPQPYYPPQAPKQSPLWLVTSLILLFIVMPLVGYWAYQAGYQSGRSTLPPGAAPVSVAPTQANQQTQPPAPGTWTDLKTWTGEGDQQTELFTAPAEWRITWNNTTTSAGGGALVVYVYTSNGQVAGVPVTTDQPSSGTSYEHAMAGTFYLDIQVVASSYTVTVQALQ